MIVQKAANLRIENGWRQDKTSGRCELWHNT